MEMKQIFGWTDPETPPASEGYVGYIMAHTHPCDTIMVAVRGHKSETGNPVSIAVPVLEARKLAQAILSATADAANGDGPTG